MEGKEVTECYTKLWDMSTVDSIFKDNVIKHK